MRLMVILLAVVLSPLAFGEESPWIIHREPIRVPAGACHDQRGVCRVKLHFVVQVSGQPSGIRIDGSSGYRECDRTAIQTIERRLYTPVKAPLNISESVVPYSCPGKANAFHLLPGGS